MQIRTRVESLISRTVDALFSALYSCFRCFSRISKCWHHRRILKSSCWSRVCHTFLADLHCRRDRVLTIARSSAIFLFVSRRVRSFCDSLSEWSSVFWESWSLNWLFISIFFFFSNRESVDCATSYRRLRQRSDLIKWQSCQCLVLISCAFASLAIQEQFQ
jgi:hypothetical protein